MKSNGGHGPVDPVAALHRLIEQEYPKLHQWVQVLIRRQPGAPQSADAVRDLATDVLHEALKRALERAGDYDPGRSRYAWLRQFAVHVLQEYARAARQDRTWRELPRRGDAGEPVDPLAEVADLLAQHRQDRVELWDLIRPEDRQVIEWKFIQGYSGREIAARLGVAEGAARLRLHRAMERLRDAYRRAEQSGNEVR